MFHRVWFFICWKKEEKKSSFYENPLWPKVSIPFCFWDGHPDTWTSQLIDWISLAADSAKNYFCTQNITCAHTNILEPYRRLSLQEKIFFLFCFVFIYFSRIISSIRRLIKVNQFIWAFRHCASHQQPVKSNIPSVTFHLRFLLGWYLHFWVDFKKSKWGRIWF